MVLPSSCAVKANANKNWQPQHLITLEVFVEILAPKLTH